MKKKPVVLVTGGCGYIGSHVVRQLREASFTAVVLDDLSTGRRESLLHGETLYEGSCGDADLIRRIHREAGFSMIMHFAASIIVPESVVKPLKYYRNNVANTLALIEVADELGIEGFVLSSSAAVYGDQQPTGGISESAQTGPIHPYGRSKLVDEWILKDTAALGRLRYVILRYFNVAGADTENRIGQCSPKATHLIKIAAEAVAGVRDRVEIYGNDYPTPDGTCIRDYVHVEDLASAHVSALKYLICGGESETLNCGYNRGYSVREVLKVVKKHAPCEILVTEGSRRTGDVPCLVAKADKIRHVLDWRPEHNSLAQIVESSLHWEKKLQRLRER